jgi:hypothetical protein
LPPLSPSSLLQALAWTKESEVSLEYLEVPMSTPRVPLRVPLGYPSSTPRVPCEYPSMQLARTKDPEVEVDVAPAAEAHTAELRAPHTELPTWSAAPSRSAADDAVANATSPTAVALATTGLGADVGGVTPVLVQMWAGQATEEPGRAAGLETGHDVPVGAPQHRRRSSTGSSGGGPDAAARANWELTDLDFARSGTRLGSPQRGSASAASAAPTGGTGPAHTIPGAGPTGAAALSPTRSAVDDAPADHSDDRWFDAGWA